MTDSPVVRIEVVDETIAVITLDRPKANAIDVATSLQLYDAFATFEADRDLRVAVLTGAGDRFFSAGWDLKAAAAGEGVQADHGPGGFAGLTEYFSRRKVVIAAVNGMAFGGGWELALAADLAVAAETATFSLPEVSLGLLADSGGLLRLPRLVPRSVATELLLTGRRMDAEEALRWGLVVDVVPREGLLDRALELARAISANAPLAVIAAREILSATSGLSVEEGFALLRSGRLADYEAMLTSADALEGPRAFADKRPPEWTGR